MEDKGRIDLGLNPDRLDEGLKTKPRELEKKDRRDGQRRVLESAGRAGRVGLAGFFGVLEIGQDDGDKERQQEESEKIFSLAVGHGAAAGL